MKASHNDINSKFSKSQQHIYEMYWKYSIKMNSIFQTSAFDVSIWG